MRRAGYALEAATPRPTRVALVVNPSKPHWRTVRDEVCRAVVAQGLNPPQVYETTVEQAGHTQAEQAVADGHDLVIAAGGDGTVREVALALLDAPATLGIVPAGTANLFARNVGLVPRNRARNIQIALSGRTARVDAGLARMRVDQEWSRERLFLVLVGVGNDAATVLGTRDRLKDRVSWLAYFESAARHVLRPPAAMTVVQRTADGTQVTDRIHAWSVLAGNCGRVPGGIVLFPQARLDDGLLDTMSVTITRTRQWVGIGAKGLLHLRRDVPGLALGQASELRVTPDVPTPVQLDGDVFTAVSELQVRVAARSLRLMVPDVPVARWKETP